MNYKIAQLTLNSQLKTGSTSEIFLAQPDAHKENLAGKLFIIIEIESKRAQDLKIINFLVNNLNYNYYQNDKIIMRERLGLKIEHIFESALARTNKNFTEFLQSEKIKFNPRIVNLTAGVIADKSLHFANFGKNRALLIYREENDDPRDKISPEETRLNGQGEYKLVDISKQTESGGKKPANQNKLFTNVISGYIPRSGYFIFTNEALPEYLTGQQLTDIVSSLPPASAAEQLKILLNKINAYIAFQAIIIKNTTGLALADLAREISPGTTQASVNGLRHTEASTEKLLTPSGIINFKKWFALPKTLIGKTLAKTSAQSAGGKILPLKDKILLQRRPGWFSLAKIIRLVKNVLIYLGGIVALFLKIITNKQNFINATRQLRSVTAAKIKLLRIWPREKLRLSYYWFKNLNKKNKILLLVLIASLALLAQNLIFSGFKNKKAATEQAYLELIFSIEQKQNQVEASLLYNNEAGAKKLLEEINGLLVELPEEKTPQQQKQYLALNAKHQRQLEKIRHVIKIEQPLELANFANLNQGAKPVNIVLPPQGKGLIYAADPTEKSIYTLSLTDSLITAITGLEQSIDNLLFPTVDNDHNIYYLNQGNLIRLEDQTEAISELSFSPPVDPGAIAAMASYNNRLYLLDSRSGQVFRYNKAGNGFATPQAWLKEQLDLTDAAGLAIDGYVYILKNSGELYKLLRGQRENFALEQLEPPLTQPTKISVSPELDYIYLLEPANKRLVVFNKAGQFILQYQSDLFDELIDFAVAEAEQKIYFLNHTSVYQVEARHFEN